MNKLWRSSKAIETNDPVGRYLFRRIGLISFPSCLRTAYNVRYQSDCPSFHPAMIAMVTGPDGTPSTLHRTYLTDDGRKAAVREPRLLMPGIIAKGAAIRLAPAGDALGIAEGIETALSASALFGVPCWAAVKCRDARCVAAAPRGDADHQSLAITIRTMPARPQLTRLPSGLGRMSARSRFRSPPRSATTGMMCISCSAIRLEPGSG